MLALTVSGSEVYAGGYFTSIGGEPRNRVAKLSATGAGAADASWNPNPDDRVTALAVSDSRVYVGGAFASSGHGQVVRNNIARFDADGVLDTAWNPGANGEVDALALSGSDLYAGGGFTSIGGQSRNRIAKLSTGSGEAAVASWNPAADSTVRALAVSESAVYAGGDFTSIGGQPRNRIAKLSAAGSGTADLSWHPDADRGVSALALSGSDLYAGGAFRSIGGQSRSRIAKLSATGSGAVDAAWDPAADDDVSSVAVSGSDVFVGGGFRSIGGQSRTGLAKLSAAGSGAADADWNPHPVRYSEGSSVGVYALAVSGSDVYAGGDFLVIGGRPRSRIAKLPATGTGTADAAWDASANSDVYALAVSGSDLYAGGAFSSMRAGSSRGFAQFSPPPADTRAPVTSDNVPAGYRKAPVVVTLSVSDAGGSGVDRTYYTTGVAPADPTTASPVYNAGAKPTLADGEQIRYFSTDMAGNAEAVKASAAAKVDTAAPSTTDDVPAGEVSGPVRVTLSVSDTGGSGVARTYYTTGASPAVPTTASAVYDPASKPTLGDGERIRYFSVDHAGNAEAPHGSGAVHVATPGTGTGGGNPGGGGSGSSGGGNSSGGGAASSGTPDPCAGKRGTALLKCGAYGDYKAFMAKCDTLKGAAHKRSCVTRATRAYNQARALIECRRLKGKARKRCEHKARRVRSARAGRS